MEHPPIASLEDIRCCVEEKFSPGRLRCALLLDYGAAARIRICCATVAQAGATRQRCVIGARSGPTNAYFISLLSTISAPTSSDDTTLLRRHWDIYDVPCI